jgi:membrane-bound metal-dependent hydrolase YbcI (DUF457 family)
MSSVLAHAAAGITAYLCSNTWADRRSRWALTPFVFLAICPDLDYVAVWWFDYVPHPRFTHSLPFALIAAVAVHAATRGSRTARFPAIWLIAAAASHGMLDVLVGAHAVPLLWPLPAEIQMPVGVLPSAGALKVGNYYLWRNLVIELGLMLSVYTAMVLLCRGAVRRWHRVMALTLSPAWIGLLVWSVSLSR